MIDDSVVEICARQLMRSIGRPLHLFDMIDAGHDREWPALPFRPPLDTFNWSEISSVASGRRVSLHASDV